MNIKDLTLPFKEDEIEWRIGQAGKKGNGQIWAMCLAYVQARAIMNRLDDVCGPENWKVEYNFISDAQALTAGVICKLSICSDGKWVTKEDGAEQTDIESFKGGLSSALKRAGSVWGIGRYLYQLESGFAKIVDDRVDGARFARSKDKYTKLEFDFHWVPPHLPAWALPAGEKAKSNGVHPEQPGEGNGVTFDEFASYRVDFGEWNKRSLQEILENPKYGRIGLEKKMEWFEKEMNNLKPELKIKAVRYIMELEKFLGAIENQDVK